MNTKTLTLGALAVTALVAAATAFILATGTPATASATTANAAAVTKTVSVGQDADKIADDSKSSCGSHCSMSSKQ